MHDMSTARIEHRSQLYHGNYKYAIAAHYSGSRYLRSLDPRVINNRYQNVWMAADMPLHELVELADRLDQLSTKFKRVCGWCTMHFYSNDADLFDCLDKLPGLRIIDYRVAEITKPKDVLLRKNPRYNYRSYFRERRIETGKRHDFLNFVLSRGDYLYLDKTTQGRLRKEICYYPFLRHSYIEYNSPMDLTMIEMVLPGLIRKTLPIQAK